jgi:hypothetical protein
VFFPYKGTPAGGARQGLSRLGTLTLHWDALAPSYHRNNRPLSGAVPLFRSANRWAAMQRRRFLSPGVTRIRFRRHPFWIILLSRSAQRDDPAATITNTDQRSRRHKKEPQAGYAL